MPAALYLVFDVESIGLHGEGYAVGWVVIDQQGTEQACGRYACNPAIALGTREGHAWIRQNTPALEITHPNPREVRSQFWLVWRTFRAQDAELVADCAWPVEARFLAQCIDDDPEDRAWRGPYPLHDVATARYTAGLDPLATANRLPSELPQHDPLADARQSARLWIEALGKTGAA